MESTPVVVEKPIKIKKFPKQRHFLAVFFISFMWGIYGIDRMYLGKWLTGLLKLLTFGGFGLWLVIDLGLIINGTMRDKFGRPMLEHAEYKPLAQKTVLIFAIVLGLIILINGLVLIFAVAELFDSMQSGMGVSPEYLQTLGL